MSYLGQTNLMKIPYPIAGDLLNESDNRIELSLIEGNFLSFSESYKNCIFNVGKIEFEKIDDFSWTMKISPTESEIGTLSLAGFARGMLFFSKEEITLSQVILRMNTYYIYVSCENTIGGNPEDFFLDTYSERLPYDISKPLLCVVSTTKDEEDAEPEIIEGGGKSQIAATAASHFIASSNPHGESLFQETAIVRNSVSIGEGRNAIRGSEYGSFLTNSTGTTEIPIVFSRANPVGISAFPENAGITIAGCSASNGIATFQYDQVEGVRINYKISF